MPAEQPLAAGFYPDGLSQDDFNAWAQTPDSTADLDARIERLNNEKEAAVADQDFQRAAALRDQADRLKQEKERRTRERGMPDVAIVDPALVADVARDLAPPA